MPRGYVMPRSRPDQSYESFREAFEWDLPATYNIANECLSAMHSSRQDAALYHVDEAGAHHEFTYEALDEASDAFAATMASWGVTEGRRVAICLPQSPELLVAHLATYKLGAVAVPVSVLLGRESMAYTLTHSDADLLVFDTDVIDDGDARTEVLDAVERTVPLTIDPARYGATDRYLGGLADVAETGTAAPTLVTSPDTPAIMLYTSGSSGRPKGVLHGHRYLIGSLPGIQLGYDLVDVESASRHRFWTPSEWAWAAALFDVVFPALALGGTVVSSVRRSGFDPETALGFVDETGVTAAFLPPTALHLIRDANREPDAPPSTLEVVLTGGEPLNPAVGTWVERELDVVLNEGYGQTEANVTVGNCDALFDSRPGSMGRPYPGHEVLVLDEDGSPDRRGEVGELAVRGPDPVFFQEYWGDPDATAGKFTDDGTLRTGDMVVRDEDGYVWFRGRKDDLIIASGYRISPVEVEDAIEEHPDVDAAVVGGVTGADGTKTIAAYVRPVASEDAERAPEFDALRRLVRDELGAHKTPDEFELLTDPPLTRTGKIDRSALFGEE